MKFKVGDRIYTPQPIWTYRGMGRILQYKCAIILSTELVYDAYDLEIQWVSTGEQDLACSDDEWFLCIDPNEVMKEIV